MRRPLAAVVVCLAAVLLAGLPGTVAAGQSSPHRAEQTVQAPMRTLSGVVLDPSRTPVAGARVSIVRDQPSAPVASASSDQRGEFAVVLAPGTYEVRIGADGFAQTTRQITVGPAGATGLEFVLLIDAIQETVNVDAPAGYRVPAVTSATRTPTPLRDVPQAISIVSNAFIADQLMTSLADVVRYMPGVAMAQGEGNRDAPILRGNGSTADFFVDGVRDDVQYVRDVYNLERVEALKGPNAMIFGRGGGGGVINRVTRQAEWGEAREVTFQAGAWDRKRLTADVGQGLTGNVATRLTAMYEDSGSYREGVGVERYGVNPSAAFQLGSGTILRTSYEYFHDERTADRGIPSYAGRPAVADPGTFFGDPGRSPVRATVNRLSSVFEHRFSERLTFRNRVSYADYDKFYQNVFPGAVNAAGTEVGISAYNNATLRRNFFNQTDVLLTRRTGRIEHSVLAGVEFGRQVTDNFRSTGYFTSLGPSVSTVSARLASPTISIPIEFRQSATDADNHGIATLAAVYVQDQVTLTPRLQAVAGLRLDAFDVEFRDNRSGSTYASEDRLVSPRLGLIYKPIAPMSIYGSYTVSYLPRSGDQLSSLTLSNQALDPETFRNYEVGAKWEVAPSLGVTGAVYRLNRGNVAVPDPLDPGRALLVDAQRTSGVELEVTGYLTPSWSISGGYAYQHGEITRSISSSAQAGAVLAQLPKHSLSLWNKYHVTDRWAVGLGVLHRDRMFASTDNQVVLPAFTRVDAGVFFDVHARLRAQVNVENLFDTGYYASAHNNNNITPGSPRALRAAITARF